MKAHLMLVILAGGIATLSLSPAIASYTKTHKPLQFLKYINNNNPKPTTKKETWAVFIGAFGTQSRENDLKWLQKTGTKFDNPFTGQPFPLNTKIYHFGHENKALEISRIVTDHLEIHALSSWQDFQGQEIEFAVCHSNGCTNAINAHIQGRIKVKHFFALGTDWTSKQFKPGQLKGADITFFAIEGAPPLQDLSKRGDPIWRIPAPNWERVTEDTPGLGFSIPFDRPSEIPSAVIKGLGNVSRLRRIDDQFPVIYLNPPPDQHSTPTQPFRAHDLVETYFPAIRQWRATPGALQTQLNNRIRSQKKLTLQHNQSQRLPASPPPTNSSIPAPPNQTKTLPSAAQNTNLRGGISADIQIELEDFQNQ